MTAVLCDSVRDVLGQNATVWLASFKCAAGVPLALVLYFTLKVLQIQDPTRQVHFGRVHQEPLEVHSAPLPSIFVGKFVPSFFFVVFSKLKQFSKPLSSFS
jgi:hypothetical protein